MPYCTVDDIKNGGLTEDTIVTITDDTTTGDIDQDKVDAAIERAEAEIDKYLAGRYDVPFPDASVPPLVKGWCVELASFYLHRGGIDIPTTVKIMWEGAKKNLKDVAAGDLEIPNVDADPDGSGLPSSTTIGEGYEFVNDKHDEDGNVTEPGNMGSGGRW